MSQRCSHSHQSFLLVDDSDQLTVSTATKGPSSGHPASNDPQGGVAMIIQQTRQAVQQLFHCRAASAVRRSP